MMATALAIFDHIYSLDPTLRFNVVLLWESRIYCMNSSYRQTFEHNILDCSLTENRVRPARGVDGEAPVVGAEVEVGRLQLLRLLRSPHEDGLVHAEPFVVFYMPDFGPICCPFSCFCVCC